MSFLRIAFLLLPLLSMAQAQPVDDAALEAATRILGPGTTVLRSGHLSAPDQTEVIAGVPVSGKENIVSRCTVLRQTGKTWTPDLTVDKVIRNQQGFLGATALDQVKRSDLYKVELFNHLFDDGKNRFVIQLTPVSADGRPSAPSIHVSWNPIVGRYQQISMQGYGFEPELNDPLPASTQ